MNFFRSRATDSSIGLTKAEKMDEDPIQEQWKWEDEHMGNFRRIYPGPDSDKYVVFFKQSGTSMFQDTVASRARQEAATVQRAEIDVNFTSTKLDLNFQFINFLLQIKHFFLCIAAECKIKGQRKRRHEANAWKME